jgi:putative phage-type endonuclease
MSKNSLPLPEQVGTARFIAHFENQSPEWHALRATGIGGSELAIITGLSKWESAFTLWAKKTEQIPDSFKSSEPMYWGTRLESVIMDEFVTRNPGLTVWDECGSWSSARDGEEWCLANPDGIYQDESGEYGIIEIKTAAYADDWILPAEGVVGSADGVPSYYRTQVQWYLRIFGFKRARVVALFSGNKYREFEVEANPIQQSVDMVMATEFRNCVLNAERPDWDGSASTYETVRVMHPEIDDADVELGELGLDFLAAHHIYAEAERTLNEKKSIVLDAMGRAKRGLLDGEPIVKRQAGRNGAAPYLMNVRK